MPFNQNLVNKLESEFYAGNPCGPFYDADEHGNLDESLQKLWATATFQVAQLVYTSQHQDHCDDIDVLKEVLSEHISEILPLGYKAWDEDVVDWD